MVDRITDVGAGGGRKACYNHFITIETYEEPANLLNITRARYFIDEFISSGDGQYATIITTSGS